MSQQGNGGLPAAPPPGNGGGSRNLPPAPPSGTPARTPSPAQPAPQQAPAPQSQPPVQPTPAQRPTTPAPAQPAPQQAPTQRPATQPRPAGPGLPTGPQGAPQQPSSPLPSRPAPAAPPASASEYYDRAITVRDDLSSYASAADRPQPSNEIPQQGGKKRFGRKSPQGPVASSNPKAKKPGMASRYAGGRMGVLVARIVIIGLVALLMLLGLGSIFGSKDTGVAQQVAEIQTNLGFEGFPTTSGSAYGSLFTERYLNMDPTTSLDRSASLKLLAPDFEEGSFDFTPTPYQKIVAGPFQYLAPSAVNSNTATFYYSALVATEPDQPQNKASWMYLAVPVYADDLGNVTLASLPSFMPPPTTAALGPTAVQQQNDTSFTSEISDTLVIPFFKAWAASDSVSLSPLVDPDAPTDVTEGLKGSVEFSSLVGATAPTLGENDDPAVRQMTVRVAWKLPSGAITTQGYLIWVVQNASGDWKVARVYPDNPERTLPPVQ